jgi:prepilin-type N-terminal cleavage/methylation domain-containing protein
MPISQQKNLMNNILKNKEGGYSLLELILAMFIGAIVLAGAYASYSVIAAQYSRNTGVAEIRDFAIPTIKLISRDLRMAGFRAVDDNIESTYARIDPPIIITDVAGACCDSVAVTYDKSTTQRLRVTYYVAARANPTRNALFMNIDQWDGNNWISQTAGAIVADYVEDFQLEGSLNNSAGYPTLLNLGMVFRSRNKTPYSNIFTKSAYANGNNSFTVTDNYLREQFDFTEHLRNLAD